MSIGVFPRDTDVGSDVVLASVGVTWVLSARKYFIVGVIVSTSTFCLFLNNNAVFLATVVDSSAMTSVLLALGRVLRDGSGMDSAAVARMNLSVEEQFRHIS